MLNPRILLQKYGVRLEQLASRCQAPITRGCTTSNKPGSNEQEVKAIPKIPAKASYTLEDCETRRKWVQDFTGADMSALAGWWGKDVDKTTDSLQGNIEMPMGMSRVPLAIVGPMEFHGEHADGQFFMPLATTEQSLVTNTEMGLNAINMSGGVKTMTGQQHMTRAPVFITESAIQASRLADWVKGNINRIQEEVVSKHSKHAKLKGIIQSVDLDAVHLLLQYETGDAAGQNMTTVCSMAATKWIVETVPKELPKDFVNIRHYFLECNMSGDKKTTAMSVITGRGMHSVAECVLSERAIREVLGTTPDILYECYYYSARMSQKTGVFHYSGSPASVLAACFVATGNDIACVGESAHGANCQLTQVKGTNDIKATMNIPSLVIGTVGGGTNMPTQAACLQVMGCKGLGKVRKFGEIIVGYCLAQDIAILAQIASTRQTPS